MTLLSAGWGPDAELHNLALDSRNPLWPYPECSQIWSGHRHLPSWNPLQLPTGLWIKAQGPNKVCRVPHFPAKPPLIRRHKSHVPFCLSNGRRALLPPWKSQVTHCFLLKPCPYARGQKAYKIYSSHNCRRVFFVVFIATWSYTFARSFDYSCLSVLSTRASYTRDPAQCSGNGRCSTNICGGSTHQWLDQRKRRGKGNEKGGGDADTTTLAVTPVMASTAF